VSVIFALEQLVADVTARFTAEGTAATNAFGWRPPAQQMITGDRVIWTPGDPNGALGSLEPARNPGRNPRPLFTLRELFTVTIVAQDTATPEDELAQYRAARLLYDAWLRACYHAARGNFAIVSQSWIAERIERRAGAAIRAVCTIDAMVPDTAATTAPVDTGAALDVEELDVTEQTQIDAP